MILKFKNNTDKNEFSLSVNELGDSRLNYHFQIHVPEELPDGEYSYALTDDEGENVFASGLVQIGEYKPNNKTYTTTENGYKQYRG